MRLCALLLISLCACSSDRAERVVVSNPYEKVDWKTFSHYRADLHVHTLQSDGCHSVDEVVRAFHDAGFSILSITDHDLVPPNFCPLRDAATQALASMDNADVLPILRQHHEIETNPQVRDTIGELLRRH